MAAQRIHCRLLTLALIGAAGPACAAVRLDGTLGPRQALSGPGYVISAELGRRAGQNLFHSFERFDLKRGESATFTGPAGIANILARVTGPKSSQIDGAIISTIPGANLVLINPNGVSLGRGAELQTSGSFIVTTADQVRLADGARFHADPKAASVLSSAPPAAFGFLDGRPAGITIERTRLLAEKGRTIALVGGDMRISQAGVDAPEGRIALVSLSGPGEVALGFGGRESPIRVMPAVGLGRLDISESRLSADDESGAGGGRIDIIGGDLRLAQSSIEAITRSGADGVGIALRLSGLADIDGGVVTTTTFGPGAGGDIHVAARQLRIQRLVPGLFAGITARSLGSGGEGGRVHIEAESVRLANGGRITTETTTASRGGAVRIDTGSIRISGGAEVLSQTRGPGRAGSIRITADRRLQIDGSPLEPTGIFADTLGPVSGDGGDVTIRAPRIALVDEAIISTSTNGSGRGGNISMRGERISIDGIGPDRFTGIASNTQAASGGGRGGSVRIEAQSLRLVEEAAVAARSLGDGDGGDVEIIARRVVIDGTAGALSETGITAATGEIPANGGRVRIAAGNQVRLVRGSISAAASADGGNVSILAGGNVFLSRESEITGRAGGEGGQIDVDSPFAILSQSLINGRAGGLDVLVSIRADALLLSTDSRILTDRPAFTIDDTLAGAITRLPASLLGPGARLEEICAQRVGGDFSSFLLLGRGGVAPEPGGWRAAFGLTGSAAGGTEPD